VSEEHADDVAGTLARLEEQVTQLHREVQRIGVAGPLPASHDEPAALPAPGSYAWLGSLDTPARHPFNPLSTLRLLVALGAGRSQVEQAFDFIYEQGRDPERDWRGLCDALHVTDADALVADPAVKQRLIANTEQAADAGVFGVPTFIVRGELFWGADTIEWMNAFVDDPGMFERGEMSRAAQIEFGVHRKP